MERLTEHSKQTSHENGICCTHFRGPECLEVGGNCAMNCKWEEAAWSRLAAYEDTRLTPERCAEFARADAEGRYIIMRDAEQEGVARLRELAKADEDGRLFLLPMKPGRPMLCQEYFERPWVMKKRDALRPVQEQRRHHLLHGIRRVPRTCGARKDHSPLTRGRRNAGGKANV